MKRLVFVFFLSVFVLFSSWRCDGGPDGRVIDPQDADVGSSANQGYGMLPAVLYDDKAAFERVFSRFGNNLGEGLKMRQWGKTDDGWGVPDANNAADGDRLHAWALFPAVAVWTDRRREREEGA